MKPPGGAVSSWRLLHFRLEKAGPVLIMGARNQIFPWDNERIGLGLFAGP